MQSSVPLESVNCVVCGSAKKELEATGQDYMYASCPDTFQAVRCTDCGHIYLDPRPTGDAVSVIYPENYASFSGVLARPSIMSRAKKMVVTRRFRQAIGLNQRPRVLEIGCGDGNLLLAIREIYSQAELTGLDWKFDSEFERLLRSRRITPLAGLAENADLPVNHYDVIIMNQLIEHLWDVDAVLKACWRALADGGTLTIETPNTEAYERRLVRDGAWGLYYFPRHLNLFSKAGLARVLERNGFKVCSQRSLLAPLGWIFTMNSIAARNPALSWTRRIFSVTNPIPIAAFTLMDIAATTLGLPTSNQKVVAVKAAA